MARLWISGPHVGPVRTTLWSSGGRKNSGGGCLFWFLALALLGAAFGVSPILGWTVIVAAVATVVVRLYLYLRPTRPAAGKPAQADEAKHDSAERTGGR